MEPVFQARIVYIQMVRSFL